RPEHPLAAEASRDPHRRGRLRVQPQLPRQVRAPVHRPAEYATVRPVRLQLRRRDDRRRPAAYVRLHHAETPAPPPPSNVHTFDGTQTILDVARSRNYGSAAAWLTHEVKLDSNVGQALIGLGEAGLAGIVPAAGTKWLTNP